MKSIVEEASSIAKAIENGWARAGKPQEFTIRIFEEPEKNFLGFTKKPAKVGIVYKEAPVQSTKQQGKYKDHRPHQAKPQARAPQAKVPQSIPQVKSQQQPRTAPQEKVQAVQKGQQQIKKSVPTLRQLPTAQQQAALQQAQHPQPPQQAQLSQQAQQPQQPMQNKWTPELMQGGTEWLNNMLKILNQPNASFTLQSKQDMLLVTFTSTVIDNKQKEQLLFRCWSHLLLQALRTKFKRGLRNYRITITDAA